MKTSKILPLVLVLFIALFSQAVKAEPVYNVKASPYYTDGTYEWVFPKTPSVQGISVGSTYKQVIGTFGTPLHEVQSVEVLPTDYHGKAKTVIYKDVSFEMLEGSKRGVLTVSGINVKGPVNGLYPETITVGQSSRSVVHLFGPESDKDKQSHYWSFTTATHKTSQHLSDYPVTYRVQTTGNKVTSISFGEDWR